MKINCKALVKTISNTVTKYSPEILTAFGVAGMVSAIILAVKATPRAIEKKEELEQENEEPTKIEYIKKIAPVYIPTILTTAASATCVICGFGIKEKRSAALATAYKLTETAYKEYKDATLETVGKKKEAEVHEKIVEKSIDKNPIAETDIINTGHGDTLFKDMASGRYFKSDVEYIRSAVNDFNAFLMADNSRTLNEFWEQIGLESSKLGDMIAWTYFGDGSMREHFLDVRFVPVLKDGKTPCVGIEYDTPYRYYIENMYL